jgi:hypothetical protein
VGLRFDDTSLMRLGLSGRFRARWSRQIHDEWKRNLLLNRPHLTRAQLDRTFNLMDLGQTVPGGSPLSHEMGEGSGERAMRLCLPLVRI